MYELNRNKSFETLGALRLANDVLDAANAAIWKGHINLSGSDLDADLVAASRCLDAVRHLTAGVIANLEALNGLDAGE